MIKRKGGSFVEGYVQEHILHYYEWPFEGDIIKSGDVVRFKNVRGTFKVLKFVHNTESNIQWVDCMRVETGEYVSYYLDKIKYVIRPKKSRRKKVG